MKLALSRTLALISLGFTTFAVTPTHAQTTANGPYYATPSWDQTLPATTRFIVLSNFDSQAVLDRETGLVWQRSLSATSQNWLNASFICLAQKTGNRGGWRLPTINELASLIDPSATTGPALPPGHPFTGLNPNSEAFWSATPQAPGVHFIAGWQTFPSGSFFTFLVNGAADSSGFAAWCVRGGVLAGNQ